MVLIAVTCPHCQSDQIVKRGKTDTGNLDVARKRFSKL